MKRTASLGQFPIERMPCEFNIDPTGKLVYSAGQSSGKMVAHRIDQATVKLKPLTVYRVGQSPAWVLVVKIPE